MNLKPEHITCVIDSREQTPSDLAPLRSERRTLATGDYTLAGLEHVVAIERKSLPDLLGCVGRDRGRFDREVQRMLGYPVRALVVESSWAAIEAGEWRSRLKPSHVIGSLLGWQAEGLPVLMLDNHERCGRYVSRMLFTVARRRWQEMQSFLTTATDNDNERLQFG